MSLLRVSVLSISGLTLWLAPPFIFARKIPLHNFMQGIALVSGFACCFEARRDALKLSKAEEFEAMKERAIDADVADELSTSIYVAEQQRRKEAEQILAGEPDREEAIEALKRAWLLDCGEPATEEIEPDESQIQAVNPPEDKALTIEEETFTSLNLTRNQAIELIKKMRSELNLNQKDIIEKLWACTKGGSNDWKKARAQFKELTGE
jgi:hypothetical protein